MVFVAEFLNFFMFLVLTFVCVIQAISQSYPMVFDSKDIDPEV